MNRTRIALLLTTTAVAATALTVTSVAYAGGRNVVYRAVDRSHGSAIDH